VVEPALVVYVKCRATGAPLQIGELARFTLAIEDVLEDAPTEAEGAVRISSGITYGPVPSLGEAWVLAVMGALRA
jgi:hypothetical protein